MTKRNLQFAAAAVKFAIFTVASVTVTYMLIVIMGGSGTGDQREFKAVFSSASSLVEGDDVRVAGIISGRVTDVSIHDRSQAIVTFKLDKDVPLTKDSELTVRFLNLIGDRYLAVTEGDESATAQEPGSTIGPDRTNPALNLTELFNGFQPLFTALDPDQVNELSMNIVQVLQGEGGTIQDLMASTASLTNSLADRDELIGDVITNLNDLMGVVDSRHEELGDLVTGLNEWFGDLATDRETIGASFDSIADLSSELADLLTRSRPLLKADVAELRRLLEILNEPQSRAILDETLEKLPPMLSKQTRIGVYGSWYNYYLCEFRGGVVLTDELMELIPSEYRSLVTDFAMYSNATRCER